MESSWNNTIDAIKNFIQVLTCQKCGDKLNNPMRYSNCGHFFCNECTAPKCSVCAVPIQPNDICSYHTAQNLIHYCEVIAEIIQTDLERKTREKENNDCPSEQSVSSTNLIIFGLNLKKQNQTSLLTLSMRRRIKVIPKYRSSVTHVIVETNDQNITKLNYDIMIAILHGKWILNSQCSIHPKLKNTFGMAPTHILSLKTMGAPKPFQGILKFWMDTRNLKKIEAASTQTSGISLASDMVNLNEMDCELFEVCGAPHLDTPRRARKSAEKQGPRLFHNCHFYFALQSSDTYYVEDNSFTKESLVRLVIEGEGNVLTRPPNPKEIEETGRKIPYHASHLPKHPLHRCTHYIIYVPDCHEPRVKYNMAHIKTLPLVWLIDCIEKFTLVDPANFGISR